MKENGGSAPATLIGNALAANRMPAPQQTRGSWKGNKWPTY
jgi:hypothetical protein